jgi:hypothetical protein
MLSPETYRLAGSAAALDRLPVAEDDDATFTFPPASNVNGRPAARDFPPQLWIAPVIAVIEGLNHRYDVSSRGDGRSNEGRRA